MQREVVEGVLAGQYYYFPDAVNPAPVPLPPFAVPITEREILELRITPLPPASAPAAAGAAQSAAAMQIAQFRHAFGAEAAFAGPAVEASAQGDAPRQARGRRYESLAVSWDEMCRGPRSKRPPESTRLRSAGSSTSSRPLTTAPPTPTEPSPGARRHRPSRRTGERCGQARALRLRRRAVVRWHTGPARRRTWRLMDHEHRSLPDSR